MQMPRISEQIQVIYFTLGFPNQQDANNFV